MMKSKKNRKPLLVACDVYRPAAIEQLKGARPAGRSSCI